MSATVLSFLSSDGQTRCSPGRRVAAFSSLTYNLESLLQPEFFPAPPKKPRPRNVTVDLIFEQLWQGERPPPAPDGTDTWSLAQDLKIFRRLVQSGYTPEELHGALSVVRRVDPYDGPMRMTWFINHKGGTPLLTRCIHHWQQGLPRRTATPPTLAQILRGMASA